MAKFRADLLWRGYVETSLVGRSSTITSFLLIWGEIGCCWLDVVDGALYLVKKKSTCLSLGCRMYMHPTKGMPERSFQPC
jgi:hypothetical protein